MYKYWIIFGFGTLLMRNIIGEDNLIVEKYYSSGLYPILRKVFDFTIGLLPFPPVYLLFFGLLWLLYKGVGSSFHLRSTTLGLWHLAYRVFAFLCLAIGLFFWVWGFNYARISFEEKSGLKVIKHPEDRLKAESQSIAKELISLRSQLSETSFLGRNDGNRAVFQGQIRQSQQRILADFGYPISSKVKVRSLSPKGLLLRISTSGVYIPFVGEGHADAGLHDLSEIFVVAHEMAHGYGITDEGVCNFVAFLTLANTDQTYLKYAGYLGLYRYLGSQYRRIDPEEYLAFRKTLPQSIIRDLNEINKVNARYPDVFPKLRDATYGAYLKSQGIKEGLASYGKVVDLYFAWKDQS